MTAPGAVLSEKLARDLPRDASAWLEGARAEVASGADDGRLCALISLASRYAPRGPSRWDAGKRSGCSPASSASTEKLVLAVQQ